LVRRMVTIECNYNSLPQGDWIRWETNRLWGGIASEKVVVRIREKIYIAKLIFTGFFIRVSGQNFPH